MYSKSLSMLREHSHSKLTYSMTKEWEWFLISCQSYENCTPPILPLYIGDHGAMFWRLIESPHFFLAVAHCHANRELNRPLLWNPLRTIIRTHLKTLPTRHISNAILRTTFRTHLRTTFRTHIKTSPYGTIRTIFSAHSKFIPLSYESRSQRSSRCWPPQSILTSETMAMHHRIELPGHDNESHVVGRPT